MGKGDYNFFTDNNQNDTLDQMCPKLSYEQRLWGFCICAGIGWFLSFCSFISFFQSNYKEFAIIFTIGNCIAVMSTCFLSGPKDQFKKMFKQSRYISTAIFFASMVFTLICALVIEIGILTLLSALVQFCAYFWYTLSYIPFGQRMLKKFFSSCCDLE